MSECKCGGIGCQTCTPPDAVGHCQRTAARQLADILQVDPDADARIDQLVNRATAGAKMSPYTITPQALAAVWAELATTDPARPCRDLPGILDAIRNVASRREPPTAVANILAELRRMDIAERRAKRTPPRYDDVYRAGVEAMATACNCGGRSCPDCGDDDARFS